MGKVFGSARSNIFNGLVAVALVVCGSQSSAWEVSEELEAPSLMKTADGGLIDTEYYSIPTVADIDGDGKSDLVVGQFMNHDGPWLRKPGGSGCAGTARWYRNESQGAELPSYASGVDLKSDSGLLYAANW